jgi:AcrR family transcriptional regulator
MYFGSGDAGAGPMAASLRVMLARRLSPSQADRRASLLEAARALASQGGYEAVTISAVCDRAAVARATLYHYFGSKDQLIAEAIVEWGREQTSQLLREPPSGRDRLERVIATLQRLLDAVERDPNLFSAAVVAFVSPDLGVGETQRQLASLMAGYLDAVFGPEDDFDHARVGRVLGRAFFALMIEMAAGRMSSEAVMEELEATARLILPPSAQAGGEAS